MKGVSSMNNNNNNKKNRKKMVNKFFALGFIILVVLMAALSGCSDSVDVGELQRQIETLKAENDSLRAVVDSLQHRAYSPGFRLQPPRRHDGLGVR